MTDLMVFRNEDFGQIRSVELNNDVWFVGKDVAEALGYNAPRNAIMSHVDKEDKLTHRISASGQYRTMTLVNESGLYSLILSSKLPTAKAFKRWITSEVLPSIRKTGSYTVKPSTDKEKAMLNNSLCRQAGMLLRCAKETTLDIWKELLIRQAANLVSGKELLPPPKTDKLYSATELGKRFNISSQKVGRIANKLQLKTTEYGSYCHDVAKHSNREVEIFMYNDKAIEVIENHLKGGVA